MCDKAISENSETLKSIPYCCRNQEMCNKALDNYRHALEFTPECCKTQNMRDKAFNTYSATIKLSLNVLWLKKCVIKQLIDFFCIYFYS